MYIYIYIERERDISYAFVYIYIYIHMYMYDLPQELERVECPICKREHALQAKPEEDTKEIIDV